MESDPDDPTFQRYDCNDATQEPPPRSVQYQAEFKSLEKACSDSVASVKDLLFNSDLKGPGLDRLRSEFSYRFDPPKEEAVKFAVFGDMASGKSSLINSLLGVGTIARSQDAGESCTFVIQRYRKRFAKQKARFAAKAYFMSNAEITMIIQSLLNKYYIASGKLDQPDDETDCDGDTQLEDADDQEEDIELETGTTDAQVINNENRGDMKELLAIFRALFCDYDCFSSDKDACVYLDAIDPKDDEAAVKQLAGWGTLLVERHLRGRTFVYGEAETCEEMTRLFQPYTHSLRNGVPDPWPLVRSVEFGLSTSLLDQGFVFIDAPGLTDANRYRRQRALDVQREASYVIIVAQTGRAMSNANLRQQLDMAQHTHGIEKTIVVLTYADKINKNTDLEATPDEEADMEKSHESVTGVQQKIQALRHRLREKPRPDRVTRADIMDEIHSLEPDLFACKMEWTCRRLALRNRKVVRSLQELYAGMSRRETSLCIFPVGNAAYSDWQEGFDNHHTPLVSLEATGIPALRAHLFTSRAKPMLNELLDLYRRRIPQMLDILDLYSMQSCGSLGHDINTSLNAGQAMLGVGGVQLLEHIQDAIDKHISTQMQRQGPTWRRSAVDVCQSWLKKHNASEQLMMLRHDGFKTWKRRKHPKPMMVNWNLDILDIGKVFLRRSFNRLIGAVRRRLRLFIKLLQDPLLDMIRNTKEYSNNIHGPLHIFLTTVERDVESISKLDTTFSKHFFFPAKQVFPSALHFHTELTLTSDVLGRATLFFDDSYLVKDLKPVFRAAQTLLGRNNVAIRRKLVECQISKKVEGPWSNLHDCIRDDLNAIATQAVSESVLQMTKMIESIRTRFVGLEEASFFEDSESKKQYDLIKAKLSDHVTKTKTAFRDDNWKLAEACIEFQANDQSALDI